MARRGWAWRCGAWKANERSEWRRPEPAPGAFIIVQEREDGSLVLAPDTSIVVIRRRHGLEPATLAEFEAEYGPVQPPDREG